MHVVDQAANNHVWFVLCSETKLVSPTECMFECMLSYALVACEDFSPIQWLLYVWTKTLSTRTYNHEQHANQIPKNLDRMLNGRSCTAHFGARIYICMYCMLCICTYIHKTHSCTEHNKPCTLSIASERRNAVRSLVVVVVGVRCWDLALVHAAAHENRYITVGTHAHSDSEYFPLRVCVHKYAPGGALCCSSSSNSSTVRSALLQHCAERRTNDDEDNADDDDDAPDAPVHRRACRGNDFRFDLV